MNPLQSTREEMRDLIPPLSSRSKQIVRLYERLVGIVDNAARYEDVHDLFMIAKGLCHEASELEDLVCKVKVLAECARDRLMYLDPRMEE